ncbi:MAG TPA: tetratricopeptide repeat protein, partial [Aggregicoccus sp.]|nr:tetratricopeptide repeat protein [Aggregicoccus sp.]
MRSHTPSNDRSSMNPKALLVRTLGAAALAFTTACASAPRTRPQPQAAAPTPAPAAPQRAQPAAASSREEGAKALFAEALAAFDAGNWEAAHKGFRKVLEKLPDNVSAQYNLGVVAERQGKLKDAEKAYLAARKLDPGHTPTLLNLGKVYRQQDKFAEAISLYEEALKAPGRAHDVALLNNLTVAYRLARKFDRAEATARQVLARSKDNAEAYKNLALIYYDQGQYRLAEFISANARKLDEKDPGIYNNLGMIYLKMNERPRALAQFQKAVSLDQQFAPGHLNIGAMALAYRDYEGA